MTRTWTVSLILATSVIILFGLWPIQGYDKFMHLTIGRWILAHGDVPRVDVFSYTTPGVEFIAHSWLAGLAFHGVDAVAGAIGFRLLRFSLVVFALGCATVTARTLGASWSAVLLVAPVVFTVVWGTLQFRAILFTTALLALQLLLLIKVHRGQWSWRWLALLPPIYAVWVNLHGGWVQGFMGLLVVAGAVLVMRLRQRWWNGEAGSALSPWALPLVGVVCGLALLLNPYGLRLVTFPFDTMQASWIRAATAEWQSPFHLAPWPPVGGGRFVPIQSVYFAYMVALVGALFAMLRRARSADLVPPALLFLWGALSLWHMRAVSDAVLLTSPFVAVAAGSMRWTASRRAGLAGLIATLSVAVVGAYLAWWHPHTFRTAQWSTSIRADEEAAWSCVAPVLERYVVDGRVFAPSLSHVILYLWHPRMRVQVFWDYVSGQEVWEAFLMLQRHPMRLPAYLDHHRVEAVLLSHYDPKEENAAILVLKRAGWVVVHVDDLFTLLVPQRPETVALIRNDAYAWLPAGAEPPRTRQDAEAFLAEADMIESRCPRATALASVARAFGQARLGRAAEARTP